jgi:GT2 family glycosyltransferase
MPAKDSVSIVIPSFNSARDLPPLLVSLKKQQLQSATMQVLMVDNHSIDDSIALAKKVYSGIKVIANRRNEGIAEGNNIGLRYAVAQGVRYIIMLNADTIADDHCVEALVRSARHHPHTLLSPKIYFAPGKEYYPERYTLGQKGKVIWYAGGIIDWQNVLGRNRGVDEVDKGQYDHEEETDLLTGCCMLIPRDVVSETNGFDANYYLYYEDTDFCVRAQKLGIKLRYVPSANLWHVNAGSSGVGSHLQDYFISRNRLLFGYRWAPLRTKAALFRESLRILVTGRPWQKRGIADFYTGNLGRGSWSP